MAKILLLVPPVFNDIGSCKSECPPLSLLYLAGYLEKHGYPDVKVIDADREQLSWHDLGNLLSRENPDIVGIGGASFILPALIKTAKIARESLPNCLLVAGGFGPTTEPEKVLRKGGGAIDLVVINEGEETLFEIVKKREEGSKDFENIAGLAFLDNGGKFISTKPRGYIMDLDSLPWPAFHLLSSDFSKYPGAPFAHNKKYREMERPVATVLASRGCPHRCSFCSLSSKLWRKRDPEDVVKEIEFYKTKFGVRSLQIYDDEFVGMTPKQNEWVEEICDEMIRKKLNLPWLVQGRCSPYVSLEILRKMREAGCRWIWFGVESGSQKILDESIQKDITVENVYRVFDLARQAGIKALMFIVVGFPGETPADIKLSADIIKKVKPDDVAIHILTPFPGSRVRKYLEDHNLLDNKLENLADYYKYNSEDVVNHHTYEMSAEEIKRYYRLLYFRFKKNNPRYFIKFMLKSLLTLDGWKKLSKRARMASEFFLDWLKIWIKN